MVLTEKCAQAFADDEDGSLAVDIGWVQGKLSDCAAELA
jgi:hypothetical protein